MGKIWLVNNQAECGYVPDLSGQMDLVHPYRLHRFLTELEDLSKAIPEDEALLHALAPRLQYLLQESEWLHATFAPPDPELGWSVMLLYDEPNYPFTLQTVVWAPRQCSPVHTHGTWGIVAMLCGTEKNSFWRPTPDNSDHLSCVAECTLEAGDMILLMPEVIHQVTVIGNQPTISLNLYGPTDFSKRYEFDLASHTAHLF